MLVLRLTALKGVGKRVLKERDKLKLNFNKYGMRAVDMGFQINIFHIRNIFGKH